MKWIEAAGDYISRHVVPARLVRKTLRVVAEDSNWASEMTYLVGPILERLQKLLPGDWVEEIRVVQGEPLPLLEAEQPNPPAPLMPATAEMRKLADESLSLVEVSDPQLAQAIRQALLARWRRLEHNKKRS